MNEVYLIYKTDARHSYDSRDIIGIASTPMKAIMICGLQASKEGFSINDDQMHNLKTLKQTQGYHGQGEFQFESVEIDSLL